MALIEGILSRFTQRRSDSGTASVGLSHLGSVRVAAVEEARFETTRAGLRFDLGFGAVTGIAPVQAIPTTAAQWFIYNPSVDKTAVVEEVGAVLVSGTAGVGILVLGALTGPGTNPSAVPTQSATVVPKSRSSAGTNPTKSSALIVAPSITLAATPNWRVVAMNDNANTAILSVAAINDRIAGSLIIPPGHGLALAVTSPAGTTPLYAPHLVWTERVTDVE